MKPTDLALLRVPGPPVVSPDGRSVAYAVTRPDLDADEYRSDLYVAASDGSAPPRRFTHGRRDSDPAWSPDGRWLAFLRAEPGGGKPQVHVMAADGGEPRTVTDHPLGAGPPVWRPDGKALAYVARVPEEGRYGTREGVGPDKEPPRRITTLRYRLDNLGFLGDRPAHVFVVDPFVDDPEPRRLTHGEFDHDGVTWSPDGRLLAVASARHADRDTSLARDVFVLDADGGDLRQVTRTTTTVARPAFSPDGDWLWFLGIPAADHDVVGRTSGAWRLPVDGSAPPERLTDEETVELDDLLTAPLQVDADGLAVHGLVTRGAVHLVRVGADGTVEPLLVGEHEVTGYHRAGGTLAATVATATSAGEVVVVRDGVARPLTDVGAVLARGAGLRPMAEVATTADDGYPVHGWVVRPAGAGPHPVLLVVHGGPYRQFGWTLFDEAQVYAGAGYAVVMGNPRGSQGYGEAHGRAIVGRLGDRDVADLLALLDTALQAPDLDAERVGVMGGSYGGWMTSWLVAHTDRFVAAVSERAVNAWDSFRGSSDIGYWFAGAYTGGDPQRALEQSPLTHAAHITTPLLVVHSEQDWRCPVEQAQRMYVELKLRGVETELLLFPGEGHELSRSGLPSHRLARFDAILDWWARHLPVR